MAAAKRNIIFIILDQTENKL